MKNVLLVLVSLITILACATQIYDFLERRPEFSEPIRKFEFSMFLLQYWIALYFLIGVLAFIWTFMTVIFKGEGGFTRLQFSYTTSLYPVLLAVCLTLAFFKELQSELTYSPLFFAFLALTAINVMLSEYKSILKKIQAKIRIGR